MNSPGWRNTGIAAVLCLLAVAASAREPVLSGKEIEVERYMVLAQLIDGRWPSDHFPVIVDLKLADCR
jgi:hypothetical protein